MAVQARLNKAKGAWGIIKHRVFTGEQIKGKNKFDLWAAAIGAIMKYGLTTLRINENMDRKIQQFTSRCMREIIYPKTTDKEQDYTKRANNEYNRKKYCLPTINSQLQKERICDIYRWRITLAPAYLNNQLEMETDLRVWEYNWYRAKEIMKKHHDKENMTQDEIEILGDYQSFCKPERWQEIETRLRTQEPPRANREFRKNCIP